MAIFQRPQMLMDICLEKYSLPTPVTAVCRALDRFGERIICCRRSPISLYRENLLSTVSNNKDQEVMEWFFLH